jgi:cell fate regulator YaaT (PSP1 superfamily)
MIQPLPQFELDLKAAEEDRLAYERLSAPKSLVVRFGAMKMVGEFPFDGRDKPGCGSKIVVRTHRGTEIGEMLTSTCPNAGCGKSVTRKQMLQYIENSGGRDYPFFSEGRALRVATTEDMRRQSELEQSRHGLLVSARSAAARLNLPMKVVDAEPILGGERLTFYFASEERVELRDLSRELGAELHARVEFRQVGARDEARLVADYERCGQYCCCKNFLKVLRPISMKSAKTQKATLDPLKISGRCGRLMCCLRYEDATYEELRKRLPNRKKRVGTPEGDGIVLDTQILTQLVLVLLDHQEAPAAFPVESLTEPKSMTPLARTPEAPRPQRPPPAPRREPAPPAPPSAPAFVPPPAAAPSSAEYTKPGDPSVPTPRGNEGEGASSRRRRRRRRRGGGGPPGEPRV